MENPFSVNLCKEDRKLGQIFGYPRCLNFRHWVNGEWLKFKFPLSWYQRLLHPFKNSSISTLPPPTSLLPKNSVRFSDCFCRGWTRLPQSTVNADRGFAAPAMRSSGQAEAGLLYWRKRNEGKVSDAAACWGEPWRARFSAHLSLFEMRGFVKSLLFIVGTIVIPHHGCCYFGSTSVAIKAGHSATPGTCYPEIALLHCAYSLTLLAGPEPASTGFAERLVYRHREMCAHMPSAFPTRAFLHLSGWSWETWWFPSSAALPFW